MPDYKITIGTQLQSPRNIGQVVNTIQRSLNNINASVSIKISPQGQRQLTQLRSEFTQAGRRINATQQALEQFGDETARIARRIGVFAVAAGGLFSVLSGFQQGVKDGIEFQRQMVRISQASGESLKSLKSLKSTIDTLSTSLGVESKKLSDAALVLVQAGISQRDTAKLLKTLAETDLAPTFKDIENTTEGIIGVMQQFGATTDEVIRTLDSINRVSAKFAVESEDLVTAIRRTGSVFKEAGGNINELIALFTSVRASTRESAETISTGFRTIFARLQRNRTQDILKEFNINLRYTTEEAIRLKNVDLAGQFVGPLEAVTRLSRALQQIPTTDPRFAQIVEEVGGIRQLSKVIPLLQKTAITERALTVARNSRGSVTEDAAKAQEALATQLQRTREEFNKLFRTVLDDKGFQAILKTALAVAEAFAKVGEAITPLIVPLAAIGAGSFIKSANSIQRGFRQRLGFNRGGLVPGIGQGDTVPAMLEPGEYVIRKNAVKTVGVSNLNRINRSHGGGLRRVKNPIDYGKLERYVSATNARSAILGTTHPKFLSPYIPDDVELIGKGGTAIALRRPNSPSVYRLGVRPPGVLLGGSGEFDTVRRRRKYALETEFRPNLPEFLQANRRNDYSTGVVLEKLPFAQDLNSLYPTDKNNPFGTNPRIKLEIVRKLMTSLLSKGYVPIDVRSSNIGAIKSRGKLNYKIIDPDSAAYNPKLAKQFRKELDDVLPSLVKSLQPKDIRQLSSLKQSGGLSSIFDMLASTSIRRNSGGTAGFVQSTRTKNAVRYIQQAFKNIDLDIGDISNLTSGIGVAKNLEYLHPAAKTFAGAFDPASKFTFAVGNRDLSVYGHELGHAADSLFFDYEIGGITTPIENRFGSSNPKTVFGRFAATHGKEFLQAKYGGLGNFGAKYQRPESLMHESFATLFEMMTALHLAESGYVNLSPKVASILYSGRGYGMLEEAKREILPIVRELTKKTSAVKFADIRLLNEIQKQTDDPKNAADITNDSLKRTIRGKKISDISVLDKLVEKADRETLISRFIRKNDGGIIEGYGDSDTIPALLTPGEFVINARAARKIGLGRLHQLNRADKIQRFGNGGAPTKRGRPLGAPIGGVGNELINNSISVAFIASSVAFAAESLGDFGKTVEAAANIIGTFGSQFAILRGVAKQSFGSLTKNIDNLNDVIKTIDDERAGGRERSQQLTLEDAAISQGLGVIDTNLANLRSKRQQALERIQLLRQRRETIKAANLGIGDVSQAGVEITDFALKGIESKKAQETVDAANKRITELETLLAPGSRKRKKKGAAPNNDPKPPVKGEERKALKKELKKQRRERDKAAKQLFETIPATSLPTNITSVDEEIAQNELLVQQISAEADPQRRASRQGRKKRGQIDSQQRTIERRNADLVKKREQIAARVARLQKIERGVTLGIPGATAVATVVGGILTSRGQKSLESGDRGQFIAGGALTTAGTFASIGLSAGLGGGPIAAGVGAAGGALIGAIYGIASSLKEADRQIKATEFGKKVDSLSASLSKIISGRSTPEIQRSNILAGVSTLSSRVRSTTGDDRADAINVIKNAIPDIEVFARQIANSSSTMNEFRTRIGGDIIPFLARWSETPIEDVEKEFEKLINESVRQRETIVTVNTEFQKIAQLSRYITEIQAALSSATISADKFSSQLETASFLSGAGSSIGTPRDRSNIFSNPAAVGDLTQFRQEALRAAAPFGDRGTAIADEAVELAKIFRELPAALLEVKNTPLLDEDLTFGASDAVVRAIEDRLGGKISGSSSRALANAIDAGIVGPSGDQTNFGQQIEKDINAVVEEIVNVMSSSFKLLDTAAPTIDGQINSLLEGLSAARQVNEESKQLRRSGLGIQAEAVQFRGALDPTFNRTGKFSSLRRLDLEQQLLTLGSQRDLVGNVGGIGRALLDSEEKIKGQSEEINTTGDPSRRKELTRLLDIEVRRRDELIGGLKDLSDVATRTAADLEELSRLEAERESKRGFVESFVFGTNADRQELNRSIVGAVQVGMSGSIDEIPESLRSGVLSILKQFGDTALPSLGGTTGNDVIAKILESSLKDVGATLEELKGITRPSDEEEKIRASVELANKNALDAIGILASRTESNNNAFINGLGTKFDKFISEMNKNFADATARNLDVDIAREESRGKVLGEQIKKFTAVQDRLPGLTTIDQVSTNRDLFLTRRNSLRNLDTINSQFSQQVIASITDKTLAQNADISELNVLAGLGLDRSIAGADQKNINRQQGDQLRAANKELTGRTSFIVNETGLDRIINRLEKNLTQTLGSDFATRFISQFEKSIGNKFSGGGPVSITEVSTVAGDVFRTVIKDLKKTAETGIDETKTLATDVGTNQQSLDALLRSADFDKFFKDIKDIPLRKTVEEINADLEVLNKGLDSLRNIRNALPVPEKRYRGGYIGGKGNRDTVPAMLAPGEFVMRKDAVNKIGIGTLKQMNKDGIIPGYKDGGQIRKIYLTDLEANANAVADNFVPFTISESVFDNTIKPATLFGGEQLDKVDTQIGHAATTGFETGVRSLNFAGGGIPEAIYQATKREITPVVAKTKEELEAELGNKNRGYADRLLKNTNFNYKTTVTEDQKKLYEAASMARTEERLKYLDLKFADDRKKDVLREESRRKLRDINESRRYNDIYFPYSDAPKNPIFSNKFGNARLRYTGSIESDLFTFFKKSGLEGSGDFGSGFSISDFYYGEEVRSRDKYLEDLIRERNPRTASVKPVTLPPEPQGGTAFTFSLEGSRSSKRRDALRERRGILSREERLKNLGRIDLPSRSRRQELTEEEKAKRLEQVVRIAKQRAGGASGGGGLVGKAARDKFEEMAAKRREKLAAALNAATPKDLPPEMGPRSTDVAPPSLTTNVRGRDAAQKYLDDYLASRKVPYGVRVEVATDEQMEQLVKSRGLSGEPQAYFNRATKTILINKRGASTRALVHELGHSIDLEFGQRGYLGSETRNSYVRQFMERNPQLFDDAIRADVEEKLKAGLRSIHSPELSVSDAERFATFIQQDNAESRKVLRDLSKKMTQGAYIGLNRGGTVPGYGNNDTVPAMLTPGEFVMRKDAVKQIGLHRLNEMNKRGKVRGYNRGGIVGDDSGYGGGSYSLKADSSLSQFNDQFNRSVAEFTKAISSIPTEFTFRHTVEVIHNGGQIFSSILPEMEKMVVAQTKEILNRFISEKFPSAGGIQ